MNTEDLQDLDRKGVYIIRNSINNIVYIGSTWQSFRLRRKQHFGELKGKKHKNSYLQNFANKYGVDVFTFEILEIVEDKEKLFIRENYWLDLYKDNRFNINPNASGGIQFPKEVIERRTATFTKTMREVSEWYEKLKNLTINIHDVPLKFCKKIKSYCILDDKGYFVKAKDAWNQGLTKDMVDYSYLKVPKTKTEAFKEGRKVVSEKARERGKEVDLYDLEGNFIKSFGSPIEASEWCTSNYDSLPVKTNKITKVIAFNDILRVCKGFKSAYKGLVFKYKQNER